MYIQIHVEHRVVLSWFFLFHILFLFLFKFHSTGGMEGYSNFLINTYPSVSCFVCGRSEIRQDVTLCMAYMIKSQHNIYTSQA